MIESDALPRRKKKVQSGDETDVNGSLLRKRYRAWLRNTEAGQMEREAQRERIAALKETWERKGI